MIGQFQAFIKGLILSIYTEYCLPKTFCTRAKMLEEYVLYETDGLILVSSHTLVGESLWQPRLFTAHEHLSTFIFIPHYHFWQFRTTTSSLGSLNSPASNLLFLLRIDAAMHIYFLYLEWAKLDCYL